MRLRYSWLKGACQGRIADGQPSLFDFFTLSVVFEHTYLHFGGEGRDISTLSRVERIAMWWTIDEQVVLYM